MALARLRSPSPHRAERCPGASTSEPKALRTGGRPQTKSKRPRTRFWRCPENSPRSANSNRPRGSLRPHHVPLSSPTKGPSIKWYWAVLRPSISTSLSTTSRTSVRCEKMSTHSEADMPQNALARRNGIERDSTWATQIRNSCRPLSAPPVLACNKSFSVFFKIVGAYDSAAQSSLRLSDGMQRCLMALTDAIVNGAPQQNAASSVSHGSTSTD